MDRQQGESAGSPSENHCRLNASRVSGRNALGFFTAWGLTITSRTRADVTTLALPAPDRGPTIINVTKAS
ncbi:hypothetical protein ACIRRH_34590 [Kitasatospora sp. NPDC101235]|uniref:hypothetical protein n=1 Tax=Kitasatospora sp. NPDC101235 TaxID=3364101 RepID=UPI00382E5DCE